MKALSVVLLVLLVATASATCTELTLSSGIDWMLGIRGGFEYLFLPRAGVQAHAGFEIPGAVSTDLFAVFRVLESEGGFSLRLLGGVPNALFPIGTSDFMLSVGAALEARWRLAPGFGLSLRAGEGYPLFFRGARFAPKTIGYPLGLWPDLFLSIWLAL